MRIASPEQFTASSLSLTYSFEGVFVLQADRFCLAPPACSDIGGMVARWWDGLVVSHLEDLLSFEEPNSTPGWFVLIFIARVRLFIWKWPALAVSLEAFNRFGASRHLLGLGSFLACLFRMGRGTSVRLDFALNGKGHCTVSLT